MLSISRTFHLMMVAHDDFSLGEKLADSRFSPESGKDLQRKTSPLLTFYFKGTCTLSEVALPPKQLLYRSTYQTVCFETATSRANRL